MPPASVADPRPVFSGRPIAGVLWDLDGTIVDCERLYDGCLRRAAASSGLLGEGAAAEDHSAAMHGMTMEQQFVYVLGLADELRRGAGAGAGAGAGEGAGAGAGAPTRAELERLFWAEFDALEFGAELVLPGVERATAAMHALGVPQALATMSTRRELAPKARGAASIFARLQVRETGPTHLPARPATYPANRAHPSNNLVQLDSAATVCWGDACVRAPKPAPDVYLEAARQIGVDARQCVAVEDTLRGVAAGAAAGCFVVACPSTKPFDAEAFRRAGAATVVESLADIDWLALAKGELAPASAS